MWGYKNLKIKQTVMLVAFVMAVPSMVCASEAAPKSVTIASGDRVISGQLEGLDSVKPLSAFERACIVALTPTAEEWAWTHRTTGLDDWEQNVIDGRGTFFDKRCFIQVMLQRREQLNNDAKKRAVELAAQQEAACRCLIQ